MRVFGDQRFKGGSVFAVQRHAALESTQVFADQRTGGKAVFGEQHHAARWTALRTFDVQRAGGNAVLAVQVHAPIGVSECRHT